MDDLTVQLDTPFAQTLEIVEAALKAEGFGVITRMDVQRAMRSKLNVDFRPFIILGAYHPPIAHRALDHDPSLGVLLPSNVSVESSSDGQTLVRLADPAQMLSSRPGDPTLTELADEIRAKLQAVAKRVQKEAATAGSDHKSWKRLSAPPQE